MPKNWSIPRTSYDALGKLNIQRSPAIDRAIWASKADPTRIIRAMEARMTQALATATATATAKAPAEASAPAKPPDKSEAAPGTEAPAIDCIGDGAINPRVNPSQLPHQRAVPGSKIVNGDEYVRISVSYPKRTEEAVEYLAGLFKLSYEETVRLSLEAYISKL